MMTAEPSGQDVSQRIRNAIKSKLVDIGCYVDDELPDYVMVMIANKKSKEQMKADLELFLGEYCGGFCDWLHQVLDHLQRFAREGKHKIDLFEEKGRSSKIKERDKDHQPPQPSHQQPHKHKAPRDRNRPATGSSAATVPSGSGDEVALHLELDEKREFEETESTTRDSNEGTKKRAHRSRSRSPLKKIEERTKKKLRERVDEVDKEVKRKEASRSSAAAASASSGRGNIEFGGGSERSGSRKRIEVDSREAEPHRRSAAATSSSASGRSSGRSPERSRGSGGGGASSSVVTSASRRTHSTVTAPPATSDHHSRHSRGRRSPPAARSPPHPPPTHASSSSAPSSSISKDHHGRDERRDRPKDREKAVADTRPRSGRDDRKERREDDRKKVQEPTRRSKPVERSANQKHSEEVRAGRETDHNTKKEPMGPLPPPSQSLSPQPPSAPMLLSSSKSRLSSTIGAIVTNDGSASECEADKEYDPSRPQLRSVATVAPRKRVVVDKDHLEKNKILAKALQDANKSTSSVIVRHTSDNVESLTVSRRCDGRGVAVKRSIQDRLGAYVTEAIAARVADVKRPREIPPSLGEEEEDADDDADENTASNDIRDGDALGAAAESSGPRIIVTMKKIPSDFNTGALDADHEVEMEDLRLSLIRSSNAAALKNAALKDADVVQTSTTEAPSISPPPVVAVPRSGTTDTVSVTEQETQIIPARKKIVVTNKNHVQVAPKRTEVVRPTVAVVEPKNPVTTPTAVTKPTAVTAPLINTDIKNKTPDKSEQTSRASKTVSKDNDEHDDNFISRNGMIVKPSPLLAACNVNVSTALAIKKTPDTDALKVTAEATAKPPEATPKQSQLQNSGTIALSKPKSAIAQKIPLKSLDDMAANNSTSIGVAGGQPLGGSSMGARGKQRCRFDPVCTNPACRFMHPDQSCALFPLCGLPAASCSYRHPPCKFNRSCANLACPYTHTDDAFSTAETGKPTPCKFFPNCTNAACPFFHPPIPCKFGLRCQALGCPYVHPEKSSVAKLRWVANS